MFAAISNAASAAQNYISSREKANLSEFLQEVNTEKAEFLIFQQEDVDENMECRPTYEQLGQKTIVHEAAKNIQILKSFETILQERLQSHNLFMGAFSKAKSSFDIFQECDGTLRQALDALFVFVEQ